MHCGLLLERRYSKFKGPLAVAPIFLHGNKRIAALVPGGRYEEIPDARHFPNVEQPEIFNKIMMGWLGLNR